MNDANDEFLAEVQEIIESISRDLLLLDQAQKDNVSRPDLINEVFRGVHTLKGIAGMFGYQRLGALAHNLEDLLDDLRLGKVELSPEVLDVLFEGADGFQRMIVDKDGPGIDLNAFARAIENVVVGTVPTTAAYDLDDDVLGVLTEYEEHRLTTNAAGGIPLYRLTVRFGLISIDDDLKALKRCADGHAEIITYLPSASLPTDDAIELDVLVASAMPQGELEVLFVSEDSGAELTRVPFRTKEGPKTELPARHPTTFPPAALHESKQLVKPVAADSLSLRSVANSVRVDIGKLDHLMNVVGELANVRADVARMAERIASGAEPRGAARDFARLNRAFERHLSELQSGILGVRLVPLGQLFDRLARIVRQFAREHDKDVHFSVTGSNTEIDKLIVEELTDPMMHLIRNAVDHGIESPKERELAGKEAVGRLVLNAYQRGNHVVIEIDDDGAGLDREKLLKTAAAKGLVSEAAASEMTEEAVYDLIFVPGFSTKKSITDVSGRGVGMDVVKTNIGRIGGVIDVESRMGAGTRFIITLPVTLAIVSALIVKLRGLAYAIPLTSIREAISLNEDEISVIDGRETVTLRDQTLTLCRLGTLFGLGERTSNDRQFVVVCASGSRRLGLVVDGLEGQQDIVVKTLGPTLRDVDGVAGATDLGDQGVALVLDALALIEEVLKPLGHASRLGA